LRAAGSAERPDLVQSQFLHCRSGAAHQENGFLKHAFEDVVAFGNEIDHAGRCIPRQQRAEILEVKTTQERTRGDVSNQPPLLRDSDGEVSEQTVEIGMTKVFAAIVRMK